MGHPVIADSDRESVAAADMVETELVDTVVFDTAAVVVAGIAECRAAAGSG